MPFLYKLLTHGSWLSCHLSMEALNDFSPGLPHSLCFPYKRPDNPSSCLCSPMTVGTGPVTCTITTPSSPSPSGHLDDQEDVGRGVGHREDGRAGQGGNRRVRAVGPQQSLHRVRVQVKVEVLRDLGAQEAAGSPPPGSPQPCNEEGSEEGRGREGLLPSSSPAHHTGPRCQRWARSRSRTCGRGSELAQATPDTLPPSTPPPPS